MLKLHTTFIILLSLSVACSTSTRAGIVLVDTVIVGDAGNAADFTGYGNVPYDFKMGKYEITINQYTLFLGSVASVSSDAYLVDLWNPNMASDLRVAAISRSGNGTLADPYSYSVIGNGNRPIAYVSWFDAARFANWMNNGATNGASTEVGSYTLNGATNGLAAARNPGATWWIPTQNEWYKSAYYKGGGTNAGYWLYATQSDVLPAAEPNPPGGPNSANYNNVRPDDDKLTDVGAYANSSGFYGTFNQADNLSEWNDINGEVLPYRGLRGGNWGSMDVSLLPISLTYFNPSAEQAAIGFRLASAVVPEPGTWVVGVLLLSCAILACWHRRRASNSVHNIQS